MSAALSDVTEASLLLSSEPPPPPELARLERAMELASRLEPDGGMPGPDAEARVAASLAAYGCLTAGGAERIFRRHLVRLEQFLAGPAVAGLPAGARSLVGQILDSIRNGTTDPTVWEHLAARLLKGEALRLADLPGANP